MRNFVVVLLALCLVASIPAYAADEVVKESKTVQVYSWGNCLYSMYGNSTPEVATACMKAMKADPMPVLNSVGGDWHGSMVGYAKKNMQTWITGEAKADDPQFAFGVYAKYFKPLEGKKPDIVLLQPTDFKDTVSLKPFRDAATQVNARFILYITAANLSHKTRPVGKREKVPADVKVENNMIIRPLADFEAAAKTMDENCAVLAKTLNAEIAPTYRTFLILQRTHPEINLHAPRADGDAHVSFYEAYANGCTLATAILRKKLDVLPDLAFLKGDFDRYAKNIKDHPTTPPTVATPVAEVITPEVQKIIHEAAWQAVQEQMELEKARTDAAAVKTVPDK
ncbi:MAG: hypothetical protein WCJ56_04625 [bacterium]